MSSTVPPDVMIDTSSWVQSLREMGDPAITARVEALLLARRAV